LRARRAAIFGREALRSGIIGKGVTDRPGALLTAVAFQASVEPCGCSAVPEPLH
jgi:hypothetical protein